jgi:sec-independent protein translocase protein TatA
MAMLFLPAISSYVTFPLFLPTLGFGELAIVFVIVLILFGPGKLPSVAKALGEGIKQFKNATREVTKDTTQDASPTESSKTATVKSTPEKPE